MSVLTSCSHIKHDTPCAGFHSPLLRARAGLRLQTLKRQSAGVRTGVNACKPQVRCQHGRQPMRRSASTATQVRAEEDMLEPVPAWRQLVSFLLKSSAVVALTLALVSPLTRLQHSLFGRSLCKIRHRTHRRHLDQSRLLKLPVVEVAWEAQASVLQDQAPAHIGTG